MSSDSTTLNKGDEVLVKFSIHNTQTFGFSGFLEYDTDVFETLEAGVLHILLQIRILRCVGEVLSR